MLEFLKVARDALFPPAPKQQLMQFMAAQERLNQAASEANAYQVRQILSNPASNQLSILQALKAAIVGYQIAQRKLAEIQLKQQQANVSYTNNQPYLDLISKLLAQPHIFQTQANSAELRECLEIAVESPTILQMLLSATGLPQLAPEIIARLINTAARSGNLESLQVILTTIPDADKELKGEALIAAAACGTSLPVVKKLLENPVVNTHFNRYCALKTAAVHDNTGFIDYILKTYPTEKQCIAKGGNKIFHCALSHGKLAAAERLLQEGPVLKAVKADPGAALAAAQENQLHSKDAVIERLMQIKAVKQFAEKPAAADTPAAKNDTYKGPETRSRKKHSLV